MKFGFTKRLFLGDPDYIDTSEVREVRGRESVTKRTSYQIIFCLVADGELQQSGIHRGNKKANRQWSHFSTWILRLRWGAKGEHWNGTDLCHCRKRRRRVIHNNHQLLVNSLWLISGIVLPCAGIPTASVSVLAGVPRGWGAGLVSSSTIRCMTLRNQTHVPGRMMDLGLCRLATTTSNQESAPYLTWARVSFSTRMKMCDWSPVVLVAPSWLQLLSW